MDGDGTLKALVKRALRASGFELSRLLDVDGRLLEVRLARVRPRVDVTPGTIAECSIGGRTLRFFVTDERDYIQRHHRSGRFYETDVLERIGGYFRGGTFVDVGANVGNHSIYAAMFLGAKRVIAFEPVASTAAIMAVNMALNGLSDIVEIRPVGLSSADAHASFTAPEGNLGAARLLPGGEGGTLRLERGDDALRGERLDFVKIDTEGMELTVLEGLRETITRERPVLLVEVEVETNGPGFFTFLEGVGYEVAGNPIIDDDCANYFAVPKE